MQRRTLWIILGTAAVVLLVLCVAIGAAGLVAVRYIEAQQTTLEQLQQQLAEVPTAPGADDAPAEPSATPRDRPARPSVTPERDQAAPTTTPAAEQSDPSAPVDLPDSPLPSGAADDLLRALAADSQSALTDRPDVPLYRISATLDPQQHTISGSQSVRLTNTEDTALDAIYFRLYVNAAHYDEGEMTVADARVNGTPVEAALEVDETALRIPLDQPLAPGQSAEIELNFQATVPESGGGYGLFNESDGVFMLYNWHPELAIFEDGEWLLHPVADQGDPTNTDVANYVVSFAAPESFSVISGGVETTSAEQDGGTAHTSVAALTRNFVVVASDQFESEQQQSGDTLVTSYYLPGSEQGGQAVLETAVKSLELFGTEFGPYPYTELDVVQVELGSGAAGMESTGMVMIGSEYYDPAQGNPLGESGSFLEGIEGADVLAFTTAHEVAHQWWYSVVGSDAYNEPWLDESLTNWSSAYYVDRISGEEAGKLARDLFITVPYREELGGGDVRLAQPVDEFSPTQYGAIVYGKGALMYDVLREELGEATFKEFLQRYYREQSFDRADSAEWLQTLSDVAGKDMTPFYEKWVEGESVGEDDLPPGGPLSDLLRGDFDDFFPDPGASDGP